MRDRNKTAVTDDQVEARGQDYIEANDNDDAVEIFHPVASRFAFGCRRIRARRYLTRRSTKPNMAPRQAQSIGKENNRQKQKEVEKEALPLRRDHENARILDNAEDHGCDRGTRDIPDAAHDGGGDGEKHERHAGLRQYLRARAIKKHSERGKHTGDEHRHEKYLALVYAIKFGEIRIVRDANHELADAAKTHEDEQCSERPEGCGDRWKVPRANSDVADQSRRPENRGKNRLRPCAEDQHRHIGDELRHHQCEDENEHDRDAALAQRLETNPFEQV